jgi:hypothetical protein
MHTTTFLSLPADVLRLIAARRPGAAGVMVQLCRRLHRLLRDIVLTFVEKDVSPLEYRDYGLRFGSRRSCMTMSHDREVCTSSEYVLVTPETVGLYTTTLWIGRGDSDNLQRQTSTYSTTAGTTGRCTHDTRKSAIPKGQAYDATIADRIVADLRRNAGRVLPCREVIRDVLRHRGDHTVGEEVVVRVMQSGMRRLIALLYEPLLDDLFALSEWTQRSLNSLHRLLIETDRSMVQLVRVYATVVLLDGYARAGITNVSACPDLPFRTGTPDTTRVGHELRLALIRVGDYLGIRLRE